MLGGEAAPEPIGTFNEEAVCDRPKELAVKTAEDTLNTLLVEETDDLIKAGRYERSADREAYEAGHRERGLTTTSEQAKLRMSKPEDARFTPVVIEHHKRHGTIVEEAMAEVFLECVSTRMIEDALEILWGSSVSASTVSNPNGKAFEAVEA